jgi:alginate O-acetyltransferase complex protein AlgI
MLFTTTPFVLLFLPLTLVGFFLIGQRSRAAAAAWLFLASVFFYGYWMPVFTLLLLGSIAFNFGIGIRIARARARPNPDQPDRCRRWLILGIVVDLALLGYFKYTNFFVDNLNQLLGFDWSLAHVILPIGISFYTFTQIAFLVDTYKGKVGEVNLTHYGLFVTFFPHLIAGPVLHHAQMMPQFAQPAVYRVQTDRLLGGMLIFAIGLFKKIVFADGVSPYADAVFGPAELGQMPSFQEAWLGAFAYTLQLYFDFSGYSDMAVGLAWMFNIRMPFNFDSPYKATSISDFWRRWHITLSNFLRDYLYIPLGGNRKGPIRRYVNLAATMLLGGLWHGANWTFLVWGGLHGAYLMINHGFRAAIGARWLDRLDRSRSFSVFSWLLTFLAVIVAWVFFRSSNFAAAGQMLQAMAGLGSGQPPDLLLWNAGLHSLTGWGWVVALSTLALAAPNSNRIGEHILDALAQRARWRWTAAGFGLGAVLLLVLINAARDSVSAFIYFNF